jgi:hypothetical protein
MQLQFRQQPVAGRCAGAAAEVHQPPYRGALQIMSIIASDPFDTLIYQQQLISTPLVEGGAGGADDLDVAQRSVTIGDVVPIVFCRRVGTVGGVLISPGATEARFENSLTNEVTASYHLALSEGELDGIQVRDVFQRSCRVGSFTQTFGRRAGPWLPGNAIIDRGGSYVKPECPYYCGTGGTYEGMTTGSYVLEDVPDGDTRWDRQVHLFIRGGMHVTRLLDAVDGPSNNVADLALWLMRNTSRMPEPLIDLQAFESAAEFTDNSGLWFNGEIKESQNFEDWLANHGRYFLLTKSKRNGKTGLRPMMPVNSDNEIDTTGITPAWRFDEGSIIPGSFELSYIPLSDRKPFCALMLWRQQPDDDIGLIRTTEVRYAGTAEDGPFEQHDMSVFATSENHVVKAGANIVARRRYITHTLRIKLKPAAFNATLTQGDIVQVVMQRRASSSHAGEHRYLYEVDRIGKARDGAVSLDLIHFPVDSQGRSLVALDVVAATGGGILLDTGKSGASCDVNADDDDTVPADDSLDPGDWTLPDDEAFDVIIPEGDFGTGTDGDGFVGGDGYGDGGSGADDGGDGGGLDSQDPPEIGVPPGGPVPGAALTAPDCGGGCTATSIQWFRDGQQISGATSSTYTLGIIDAGSGISVRIVCLDEDENGGCEAGPVDVPPYDDASGVDRAISASWTITTNNMAGNSCVTGDPVGSAGSSSSGGGHSGTGVGYRVTRGSSFASQVCGLANGGGAVSGSGILIELLKQDGSTEPAFVGAESTATVVGPESGSSYFASFSSSGVSGLTVTG